MQKKKDGAQNKQIFQSDESDPSDGPDPSGKYPKTGYISVFPRKTDAGAFCKRLAEISFP